MANRHKAQTRASGGRVYKFANGGSVTFTPAPSKHKDGGKVKGLKSGGRLDKRARGGGLKRKADGGPLAAQNDPDYRMPSMQRQGKNLPSEEEASKIKGRNDAAVKNLGALAKSGVSNLIRKTE